MTSTYINENNLIRVNGFIDFDENGEIIMVPTMPKPRTITLGNIVPNTKKRKAYDTYEGDGKYECNICHKKFVKKSYWKEHEASHEEKVACKICGTEFMHNTHLNQHMKVHEEKQHRCEICGIKVRFKFNLKRHLKIHVPYRDKNGDIKYYTFK
jgi:hypothetical protein